MWNILLEKRLPGDFDSSINNRSYVNAQKSKDAVQGLGDIVDGIGTSGMNLALTIFVYIAAIGLVIWAIKLIKDAGNPEKLSEGKGAFFYKVIAIILGFSAVGLVVLAWSIGKGLFN